MNIDAWKILGLNPGATKKEIRKQYAKLSRQCHPEEEPEEFAELQNAYQCALEYCEGNVERNLMNENDNVEIVQKKTTCETDHSLLDKLEQKEDQELQLYIKTGIIKTILDILSDPKSKNKATVWQKLFLSDAFLDEQFTDHFAHGLQYIFQSLPEAKNVNEVPSAFLTELAIAYGVVVEDNEGYRFRNELPAERIIISYWFSMPEEWYKVRAAGYLKKLQNRNRARSFANYQMLISMNENTFFNESESLRWKEILWNLQKGHFYELYKAHETIATGSKIFIDLCVYWLSHYEVPEHVAGYIYEDMQLDKIDFMSCGGWYRPLKDCIMRYYPNLECVNEKKQKIQSEFANEYMKIKFANSKLEEAYEEGKAFDKKVFDKKVFDEKCHSFFESDIWKKHATDEFIEKYMIEKGGVDHLHYDAIAPMLDRYYDADKEYEDLENALLEHLIRGKHFSRLYYGIEEDKRALYVMMYAFGIRKIRNTKINKGYGFHGEDGELNFPMYIDYLFSVGKCRKYEGEEYEHLFADGSMLKYKLGYQNVSVSWNGCDVYGDVLLPWKVLEYAAELSELRDFAALLSIMDRKAYKTGTEEEKVSVRQCIDNWLMPLKLTLNIRNRIIDCILMGEDELSSLGDFVLCQSNCRKLYVTVEENKYIPYLYSVNGLTRLPEYMGENVEADLESVPKVFDLPSPNLIKAYETKGISKEKIANIIYEGFLINAKNDPVNGEFDIEKYDDSYNTSYVKEYMEREGKFLQNAFVVIKQTGECFSDGVLSIALFGQGVCSPEYYNRFGRRAQELENTIMKRFSEKSKTIGWFASEYNMFAPQPFAIGESGNLYIESTFGKPDAGKSIKDIIKYHLPIAKYESVKVYENILSWDRFADIFDYSFQLHDYEKPHSLANYFGTYRFSHI